MLECINQALACGIKLVAKLIGGHSSLLTTNLHYLSCALHASLVELQGPLATNLVRLVSALPVLERLVREVLPGLGTRTRSKQDAQASTDDATEQERSNYASCSTHHQHLRNRAYPLNDIPITAPVAVRLHSRKLSNQLDGPDDSARDQFSVICPRDHDPVETIPISRKVPRRLTAETTPFDT